MMTYTKLFNSLLTSTIWTEDNETRIVWITMLAMADKHGEIHGSIPGLARQSGVSIEAVEKALEKFLAPDPYSRSEEDEGRRIEEIAGGWSLINHAKYRKLASKEDEKEKAAERKRRQRERDREKKSPPGPSRYVTPRHGEVTQERDIAEAEADTEADSKGDPKPKKTPPSPHRGKCEGGDLHDTLAKPRPNGSPTPEEAKRLKLPNEVLDFLWENAPEKARRRSSKAKIKQAWAKIQASERPDFETITRAFKAWTQCDDWTKHRGEYVTGLHRWINEQKWESPPETRSATAPPKKIIEGPLGWKEAFRELIPHGLIPLEWGHVDQGLRDQIFEVLNRSTAKTGTGI